MPDLRQRNSRAFWGNPNLMLLGNKRLVYSNTQGERELNLAGKSSNQPSEKPPNGVWKSFVPSSGPRLGCPEAVTWQRPPLVRDNVVTCGLFCYLRNRAVLGRRITIGTIAGHLT